jgi:hypothetical protein
MFVTGRMLRQVSRAIAMTSRWHLLIVCVKAGIRLRCVMIDRSPALPMTLELDGLVGSDISRIQSTLGTAVVPEAGAGRCG